MEQDRKVTRGGKSKTMHSFHRHLTERGAKEEHTGTEERPCMCMHTTNKTDRRIFSLCLVCDQQLLENVRQTERPRAPEGLWTQKVKRDGRDEREKEGRA